MGEGRRGRGRRYFGVVATRIGRRCHGGRVSFVNDGSGSDGKGRSGLDEGRVR